MSAMRDLAKAPPPAIFSYGFRPFFLAAAIVAALTMLAWLPLYLGLWSLGGVLSPLDWHIHEMLYGYAPAVIGGFLLTAIANWTGRPPVQGLPLAILFVLWLAGRVALLASGAIGAVPAALVDSSFLALLIVFAFREIAAAGNWRNLPPLALVFALLVGNVVFHVETAGGGSADFGVRIGVATIIALIALIGGRVIPAFTRNWLARENPGRLPQPFGRFDAAALGVAVLALAMWIAAPEMLATAAALALAGVMHAARLARWAGDRTTSDRLVLILHVGYAFLPLGFLLLAASIAYPHVVPRSAGLHAWTAGTIGVMTLAIMTRATLGHTGQPLAAGPLTQVIYAAVVVSAVARVLASLAPGASVLLLTLATAAWVLAFGGFAAGYFTLLTQPRQDASASGS